VGLCLTCLGSGLVVVPYASKWVIMCTSKIFQILIKESTFSSQSLLALAASKAYEDLKLNFGWRHFHPPPHPSTTKNSIFARSPPILGNFINLHL
jgi:hypothetical protein